MRSKEIRQRFLDFFEKKGHKIVPSSSLLPADPSVLFTTAGMQQFKEYYTDKPSPYGTRAASAQKCFRTSDIEQVGDDTHLTFLEMLGNFAFQGEYFKKEAIEYAKEFLDSVKLKIDYVTVFEGDPSTGSGQVIPKDEESEKIWNSLGFSKEKGNLQYAGREDNFWGPTGNEGPCGPTTEIYIKEIEIWNIVFNEYYCSRDGSLEPLKAPGVDTGMGLERLAMVVQNKSNVFETDLFLPILEAVNGKVKNEKAKRIIADHVKGAVFLAAEGVFPSNVEGGYVLRRILRRAIRFGRLLELPENFLMGLAKKAVGIYKDAYPEVGNKEADILTIIQKEQEHFSKTLERGIKEFEKLAERKTINGEDAFHLYDTFGFPLELTKELAKEKDIRVDTKGFEECFKKHQEVSKAGLERKFGGHGLLLDTGELKAANQEEMQIVTRLHTATHLLQAALRKVLGDEVKQAGSDITVERTRFDFTFPKKLAPGELKKIEDLVQKAIARDLLVEFKEMPFEQAVSMGALFSAKEKYPELVKVYSVFDPKTKEVFSRELCGGPHVTHTSQIGKFKILKEESSSAGIRRIRAIIQHNA